MSLLGQLSYQLYYRQVGHLKILQQRGLVDATLAYQGQKQLNKLVQQALAQPRSPKRPIDTNPDAPVFVYLGGDGNVSLLFVSLCSLYLQWLGTPPVVLLISDGRLSESVGTALTTYFPTLKPIYNKQLSENLDVHFPRDRFPHLRSLRDSFLLARKLLDVYTITSNWAVFVDADTAFLNSPRAIAQWVQAPNQAFYLLDRTNSYSYPLEVMAQVAGLQVPEHVNTGLLALKGDLIDWNRLEQWYAKLSQEFALNHFVEQSLTAMIFATINAAALPSARYVCEPTKQQVVELEGEFHHYVWPCRHLFYGRVWQDITKRYLASL